MKKITLIIIGCFFILTNTYAQSDETIARSYFIKAQEFYSNGNNTDAITNLKKTTTYLKGISKPRIDALYVQIYNSKKQYVLANKYLTSYFENANEDHADYIKMLNLITGIKDVLDMEKRNLALKQEKQEKEIALKVEKKIKRSKFDKINRFRFGLAAALKGKKCGYVNEDYDIIIPFKEDIGCFDFFTKSFAFNTDCKEQGFKDGKIISCKKGVIDRTGKIIVPMLYGKIGMHKGNFHVVKDGFIGVFTDKGRKLIDAICDNFYESLITKNGTEYFILAKEGKQILFNKDGSNSGFIYDDIEPLKSKNKTFGFRVKKGILYGVLDQKGNKVLPCQYSKITTQDDDNEQTYFYRVQNISGGQKLYNANHELVSGKKEGVPYTYNLILWTQNAYSGIIEFYAGKSKYVCSFKGTQFSLKNCVSKSLTKEEKKRAKDNGWIKKSWWTSF